jgi:hypothetical protein
MDLEKVSFIINEIVCTTVRQIVLTSYSIYSLRMIENHPFRMNRYHSINDILSKIKRMRYASAIIKTKMRIIIPFTSIRNSETIENPSFRDRDS